MTLHKIILNEHDWENLENTLTGKQFPVDVQSDADLIGIEFSPDHCGAHVYIERRLNQWYVAVHQNDIEDPVAVVLMDDDGNYSVETA